MIYACTNCAEPIGVEQWQYVGCCETCERELHSTWAKLDREYDRTRDPLS